MPSIRGYSSNERIPKVGELILIDRTDGWSHTLQIAMVEDVERLRTEKWTEEIDGEIWHHSKKIHDPDGELYITIKPENSNRVTWSGEDFRYFPITHNTQEWAAKEELIKD